LKKTAAGRDEVSHDAKTEVAASLTGEVYDYDEIHDWYCLGCDSKEYG
jgi:hypothetical protein